MNDPMEIRKLQTMAEETARQVKRADIWSTRGTTATNFNFFVTPAFPGPHGFIVGDAVGYTGNDPTTATKANYFDYPLATGRQVGVVIAVADTTHCTIALRGYFKVKSSPFNVGAGKPWYLTSTAGTLTYILGTSATKVTNIGQWLRPLLIADQDAVLVYGNYCLGDIPSLNGLSDVSLIATVTDGDLLTWNAASNSWRNVPGLSAGGHAATSVIGRSAGTSGTAADIAATADNQALVRTGGTLAFQALPVAAIANIASTTVLGNATAGAAAVTAIAAAADNTVLLRTSGTLSFGAVPNAALANSSLNVNTGTGLTGGGAISLGGSITINNSGVLTVTGTSPIVSSGGTNPAISIGANTIDGTQLKQLAAYSVLGNGTSAIANAIALAAATDGQILQRQGTSMGFFTPSGYTNVNSYTASSTFTVPAGVYSLFVIVKGSGGGGAGIVSQPTNTFGYMAASSSGGGEGGTAFGFIPVVPGQVITVTIGAAGAAGSTSGTNGSAGGNSSVGSLQGNGGSGGTAGGANANATGVGAGGDFLSTCGGIYGQAGHLPGVSSFSAASGNYIITTTGGPGGGAHQSNDGSGGAGATGAVGGSGVAGTVGTKGYAKILY